MPGHLLSRPAFKHAHLGAKPARPKTAISDDRARPPPTKQHRPRRPAPSVLSRSAACGVLSATGSLTFNKKNTPFLVSVSHGAEV